VTDELWTTAAGVFLSEATMVAGATGGVVVGAMADYVVSWGEAERKKEAIAFLSLSS